MSHVTAAWQLQTCIGGEEEERRRGGWGGCSIMCAAPTTLIPLRIVCLH